MPMNPNLPGGPDVPSPWPEIGPTGEDYGYPGAFRSYTETWRDYANSGIPECDPSSRRFNPAECRRKMSARSSWGQRGPEGGMGGAGSDWWDKQAGSGNQYEELLDILRKRFIQDPFQKAQGAAAGAMGGMGYDDWLGKLYGAAGAPTTGSGGFNRFEREDALKKMTETGSPLLGMIHQIEMSKAGAFGQAYGQSIGPATSMVQGSGGQLQGYRGQDQQRYLEEMRMKTQLQMAAMQAKAAAAARGGGGLFDILGALTGFIPYLGGMTGGMDWLDELFGGGSSGNSGGGMQYTPGWLGGGY